MGSLNGKAILIVYEANDKRTNINFLSLNTDDPILII